MLKKNFPAFFYLPLKQTELLQCASINPKPQTLKVLKKALIQTLARTTQPEARFHRARLKGAVRQTVKPA